MTRSPSTAKQRYWLYALDLHPKHDLTRDEASSLLDKIKEEKRYFEPATPEQYVVADRLGMILPRDMQRCEVAGAIYDLYFALAWVFTIWRQATGENAGTWAKLSLSLEKALPLALDLLGRDVLSEIKSLHETDELDLFYHIAGYGLIMYWFNRTRRELGFSNAKAKSKQRSKSSASGQPTNAKTNPAVVWVVFAICVALILGFCLIS